MMSNKSLDICHEDDHNILTTTPEFLAYVAKQLSQYLDNELAESISDNVWHSTPPPQLLNPQPRKHKLSTSSESSEDEKISACVFSVTDLEEEIERLAGIKSQTKAIVDSVQATVKEVAKKIK
ncbi:protein CUSTOS-like [Physella acuta]|uniref:protein CUSTOS-like n=1 Tax=Physella acuta TaxID=109671 RepID=UPI0027DB7436|nr:protein CUSTOS-like [Physella acuta]